jgi:MYXO-CTERM domain-containing protein
MKLHASLGIGLFILAAGSGMALAEDNWTPEPVNEAPERVYIPIDSSQADITPEADAAAGGAPCRLIYLNNCLSEPNGNCVVRSGFESSINDTSSIISGTRTISGFDYPEIWDEVVQCVRDTYAPFDIEITDVDPGTACHWENIVAGSPTEAGFSNGVGGVSPFSCGIINNSITYTFANIYGPDVVDICWTVAQETAHSWGLEHEVLQNDPMTYLQGSTLPGGFKRFQNQTANCGEFQARTCDCGGTTQNSYAMIMDIFGAAAPSPPDITITEPANGDNVSPGFVVRAEIDDANGVAQASLEVNDAVVQTLTTPPFYFNAPDDLTDGTHRVRVVATDTQGTQGASAVVSVVIGPPCETPGDCAEQGENLTCVGGRCVPGEGADGGLGDECEDDANCLSGQCEHSTDEGSHCVESCELGSSDCPSGFKCIGSGFCWPGDDGGGLFGCSTGDGSTPTLPILLGLGLGAMFLRRRRTA